MSPNENWIAAQNAAGASANLYADFEMVSGAVLRADGKPFLLMLLNPVALGVEGSAAPSPLRLESTPTATGYQFDVLGAKLGMEADEAEVKLSADRQFS